MAMDVIIIIATITITFIQNTDIFPAACPWCKPTIVEVHTTYYYREI